MKNTKKLNKVIFTLFILIIFCFGILLNNYVTAVSNQIYITSPAAVEEGQVISFTITFNSNVNNIWLSDGDIIKVGFSGIVKVNKVSNNKYTVTISNISNVGDGKYIVINSGVGYVDGTPTSSANSNVFSITAKKVVNDNNNENTNNSTGNSNNQNNNNTDINNNNNNNNNNNTNNNNVNNNNTNINNNVNNNADNTKPNSNILNNSNQNIVSNNSNVNNSVINESQNVENKDSEKNEENAEKIKREIPNTGKIF